MHDLWLPLKDIPAEGREFSFSDQAIWQEPCAEFSMNCTVREPLQATVHVLPQKEGYLLRGHVSGEVALPCDRCAEDAVVAVDQRFDEFEVLAEEQETSPAPQHRSGKKGAEALGGPTPDDELSPLLRQGKGGVELNVGALFWEQFLLALPVKPLCFEGCKGLCPQCGQNKNLDDCDCPEDEGDPRLATLRNMRLS